MKSARVHMIITCIKVQYIDWLKSILSYTRFVNNFYFPYLQYILMVKILSLYISCNKFYDTSNVVNMLLMLNSIFKINIFNPTIVKQHCIFIF